MALTKEVVCRIVVKDKTGRTQFWSGTVYLDGKFRIPNDVIFALQEMFK
jgi:hypothetical protein